MQGLDFINRISRRFRDAGEAEKLISPERVQSARATRLDEGSIRKAYCKNNAGAGTTIVCYLDTDLTGIQKTVNCSIVGGSALNAAIPRLEIGDIIYVTCIGGAWHCLTVFQTTENCICSSS